MFDTRRHGCRGSPRHDGLPFQFRDAGFADALAPHRPSVAATSLVYQQTAWVRLPTKPSTPMAARRLAAARGRPWRKPAIALFNQGPRRSEASNGSQRPGIWKERNGNSQPCDFVALPAAGAARQSPGRDVDLVRSAPARWWTASHRRCSRLPAELACAAQQLVDLRRCSAADRLPGMRRSLRVTLANDARPGGSAAGSDDQRSTFPYGCVEQPRAAGCLACAASLSRPARSRWLRC